MEKLIPRLKRFRLGELLPILMLLGGCAGRSPPTEFFMLEPERHALSDGAGRQPGPVIAVGPIRVPDYLDRPQIVTAKGGNAYSIDDRHRWAERLDDNIARVLARDIEALTPTRQVWTGASERGPAADFRVAVSILEFHVEPDGQALLTAQWTIRRGSETLISRTTSIRAAASTHDYGRIVSALNDCVNRLGRTIAGALREMTPASAEPHL